MRLAVYLAGVAIAASMVCGCACTLEIKGYGLQGKEQEEKNPVQELGELQARADMLYRHLAGYKAAMRQLGKELESCKTMEDVDRAMAKRNLKRKNVKEKLEK